VSEDGAGAGSVNGEGAALPLDGPSSDAVNVSRQQLLRLWRPTAGDGPHSSDRHWEEQVRAKWAWAKAMV
jgi:hypothetical protein